MIQPGEYTPLQKLATVFAMWEGGPADGPEYAKKDRLGRPLVAKWEHYARHHGCAAVRDYVRLYMPAADRNAVEALLVDFCRGGLSGGNAALTSSVPNVSNLRDIFRKAALDALEY